jgi:hypothetical protein
MCQTSLLRAAAKSWLARFGVPSGVPVDNNIVAATVVFETLAAHGSGHRMERWAEDTAKLVLTNPQVLDCSKMLSRVISYAALLKDEEWSKEKAIEIAATGCTDDELKNSIEQLQTLLNAGKSPAEAAEHFGWGEGISTSMLPTTVMSFYCWLQAPGDFEAAVLPALNLGGDSASMGATVGALVGGYKGIDAVPANLLDKLGGTPHGPEWIEKLAARLSHWPHGEHDLHLAPAQPSDPIMQLIRNKFVWARFSLSRMGRIPRRMFGG